MAIEFIFMRSRFARKMFVLFLSASLVPVAVLAYWSHAYMHDRLTEQSFERSRQSAKSFGLEVYSRLQLADRELKRLAGLSVGVDYRLEGEAGPNSAFLQVVRRVATQGGPLAAAESADSHPVALLVEPGGVVLARRLQDGHWLAGHLNPEFLFAARERVQGVGEVCVAHRRTVILSCSDAQNVSRFQTVIEGMELEPTSGRFSWSALDNQYFTSFWTVFLRGNYVGDDWTVYVSQTAEEALEALEGFNRLFVPVVILAVLIIVLVTLTSIRNRLAPLDQLRQATMRVSAGQIRQKLEIDSGDEFEDLSDHFNNMTRRLDRQFQRLSMLASIDRLVLSSRDLRAVVESVLQQVLKEEPCQVVGLLVVDVDRSDVAELTFLGQDMEAVSQETLDISTFNQASSWQEVVGDIPGISILSRLAPGMGELALAGCHIEPVFLRERLHLALIVGYSDDRQMSEEESAHLKELAGRVGVAVSNARWEEALYRRAHYDQLTELPNRALLHDRLQQAMIRADRDGKRVAVLLIDLDRFKVVNDSFGHAAGDELLKAVSRRLVGCVRAVDTVVRFGGDEFVMVIADLESELAATRAVETISMKILESIGEPLEIEGRDLRMNVSIGVSRYPDDGRTLDDLIKHADTSMYRAKAEGGGTFQIYDPRFTEASRKRLELENDLYQAAERGELELYYQPQINGMDGRIVSAEALLRWHHPRYGLIGPGEFIPIAEETRAIISLGNWVLRQACAQAKAWERAGHQGFRVSVNASGAQFRHSDVAALVQDALKAEDLNPALLGIEITETDAMQDLEVVATTLGQLSELGVHLSIDDFGTGYCSLNYLQRLPFDELKIDYSFTRRIGEGGNSDSIVTAIVLLASALDLSVIAEGVETHEQLTFLSKLGCVGFQGWLFGKALPLNDFDRLLTEFTPLPASQFRPPKAGELGRLDG